MRDRVFRDVQGKEITKCQRGRSVYVTEMSDQPE